MMNEDLDRRSRLLSLKLRALVREHLQLTVEPSGTSETFALGSSFITADAVWVLVDGDASRALGPVLAWTAKFHLPVQLVVETHSGLLARRAQFFNVDITVWHADEKTLLPAVPEPLAPIAQPKESHLSFIDLITSVGADAVVEHGIVVGEVRGLEMCRVVDDVVTGEARLEVGMGVNDREAFAMVHGELPTEQAMRNVIEAVAVHREFGANAHPFNQFGAERFHRWRALQDPSLVGFSALMPTNPPLPRTNLKDAVPCAAIGVTTENESSVAVFVNGVDLDVVPFAVDVAIAAGVQRVVIAARECDITPSIRRIADASMLYVQFAGLNAQ
jgi:hypothetical protein